MIGTEKWPWLGSTAVLLLLCQQDIEVQPHKAVFCGIIFMDGNVKYQSEMNKSHPRLVAALQQG